MKPLKFLSALLIFTLTLSLIPASTGAKSLDKTELLVLGDSIALGTNSSYCAGTLVANSLDCRCTVLAKDGLTSAGLFNAIHSYSAQILKADAIFISIGGNDFLGPILQIVNEYRSADEPISAAIERMKKKTTEVMKKYKERVPSTADETIKNIGKITAKIKAINPKVKIMYCNMYNPVEAMEKTDVMYEIISNEVKKFAKDFNNKLSEIEGIVVLPVNESFAGNSDIYTNAFDFDVHPSDDGQLLIASLILSEVSGRTVEAAKRSLILLNYSDKDIKYLPAAVKTGLDLTRIKGDADDDGTVDSHDALLALKYSTGKLDSGRIDAENADADKDNTVDTNDVTLILQYDAKLITQF